MGRYEKSPVCHQITRAAHQRPWKSCIQQPISHTAALLAYLHNLNLFSHKDASRPETMTVTIGTYNVDNIKTNVVYTQSLIDICDILFIQENWLYKFEQSTIQTLFPIVNWFVKSADEYNPQPLTHYARGHAGIGILWNNKVDHLMEVHREEGSERIAECTLGSRQPGSTITII